MINNGFINKIDASGYVSDFACHAPKEQNKIGDHFGVSQLGLSGRRDLQGHGLRGLAEISLFKSDSLDNGDRDGEHQYELPEVRYEPKTNETAFWLDVVPGI